MHGVTGSKLISGLKAQTHVGSDSKRNPKSTDTMQNLPEQHSGVGPPKPWCAPSGCWRLHADAYRQAPSIMMERTGKWNGSSSLVPGVKREHRIHSHGASAHLGVRLDESQIRPNTSDILEGIWAPPMKTTPPRGKHCSASTTLRFHPLLNCIWKKKKEEKPTVVSSDSSARGTHVAGTVVLRSSSSAHSPIRRPCAARFGLSRLKLLPTSSGRRTHSFSLGTQEWNR